jgi:hypothetical protein
LNNLIKDTEWEKRSLEDIVLLYIIYNKDAKIKRFIIMLPNIGIILSIGIALPHINLSQLESF